MGLARAFFEDVRQAAIDAERCKVQLDALEVRAKFGTGSGYHERVQTSGNAVERRMVGFAYQHDQLEKRRDRDFKLIDRACEVLYGADQMGGGGLCSVNPLWADLLYHRYANAESWKTVAARLGYSVRPCQYKHNDAIRALDRLGLVPSEW